LSGRRAPLVSTRKLLEPEHALSARGEMRERSAAHAAQTQDDGVVYLGALALIAPVFAVRRRLSPRRGGALVTVRFLGLDLAWSDRNPSGLAALDEHGRLVDVRADLRDDATILAWIRAQLGSRGIIGIDMPTIVRNADGVRPCERELGAVFRHAHAAPHPANLRRFPDGGRARRLIDALQPAGVIETLDVHPRDPRIVALEIFPHPAHVRLFALERIFGYKKKARPWPAVLAEWSRYRAALATLCAADPPLHLGATIPHAVGARGYKRWDDTLDAITCAYVAAFIWRWGLQAPHVRVFGDLESGYIVVPDRVWAARGPGTQTA
jgi:predicted RNase H-like nuclease